MTTMRLRIGIIVAVLFSLLPIRALACSCAGVDINGCQVPRADIIIRAVVVSKELPPVRLPSPGFGGLTRGVLGGTAATLPTEPWGQVKVTLKVSERFQGSVGDSLIVRTEESTSACGYPFVVGNEYLVFANEEQGMVRVTSCSATQPAKMAMARIVQLRALRDATTLPDIYGLVKTHPLISDQSGWEKVQPVAGLTVTARSGTAEYQAQTNDIGLYGFRTLPAGRYQLTVSPLPGRIIVSSLGVERFNPNPGDGCATNWEVFWDGIISGQISRQDGGPASGSIMAQFVGDETSPPQALFGAEVKEGNFQFQRLPPGRYRLMFIPTGGNRAGEPSYYPGTVDRSAATLIELGEGEHAEGLRFIHPFR